MKVAIVGAGLTGLSCALALKDYDVVLFEKDEIGGLLSSYRGKGYTIEKFYHHCFRWDEELLKLVKGLGLSNKLVWKTTKIGFSIDGKIYPLNTPFEILRYPYLSLGEKIRLARFTLKSRKRDYRTEDDKGVVDGILDELGEGLLERFFMPLLRAKFGEHYQDISYAWLLARVSIRSNRKWGGEELGYLRHGFHQLVERMIEKIDVEIRQKAIESIGVLNGRFIVGGEDFDVVVWTAPLPYLDEKIKRYVNVPEIRYQSSICALLSSDKSLSDLYWINVDKAVFGAIIEHTNFMPLEDYGEHLIYLASYSTPDGWLFNLNERDLGNLYLKEIERFGLDRKHIRWIKVFKAKYSAPLYENGYLKKIIPYRTNLKGFYIAGLVSPPNYPERSMNGSVKAGFDVARCVMDDFG